MKTRNVKLENTPLLTNNICKYIFLEAPTLPELRKKVKEYEIMLVRALTNAYKISNLLLDKNGSYTILPDGNYQSSIYLNFSGVKKDEITNPEKTLHYVKHLTAMESKGQRVHLSKTTPKETIKKHHKSLVIPIEVKQEDKTLDIISSKQRQLLEKLISDTNLIKISFFTQRDFHNYKTGIKTLSLKVEYDYRDIIEKSNEHCEPEEEEDR